VSSPDEKLSCDPEPRSGERYITWGVSPRIRARKKEKAAERRQQCGGDACCSHHNTDPFDSLRSLRTGLSPPPGACRLYAVPTLGLRAAFGRRDAPSPASGRWPAIPDLGHVSLPPAGSRPRPRICRSSGAPPQVSTSFRTTQRADLASWILYLAGWLGATPVAAPRGTPRSAVASN